MSKNNENNIEMAKVKFEVPFFQVSNDIFDLNLEVSTASKLVYIFLCRCGNQGSTAFPSYNTIAFKCGIGRRTAINCVSELINAGLLYKEIRSKSAKDNDTNIYVVNYPANATCNRLTKEDVKNNKKTRTKKVPSATDAPGIKIDLGGATDALGGATDALGGATDAPKKEQLKKEPLKKNSISSCSRDKTLIHDHFEKNICTLKPTSKKEFDIYAQNLDLEFLETVINYCASLNANSFKYFKTTLEAAIKNNNTSKDLFIKSLEKNKTLKTTNSKKSVKNGFNNFKGREYDYDALERKLLGWDNDEIEETSCNYCVDKKAL